MTIPSIPAYIPGSGPQASTFTGWTGAATFFRSKVVFRAEQATTATTLPSSGAVTLIKFDDVLEDPYSGYSASTGKWTAPAGYSGTYLVTLTVWIVSPVNNTALALYLETNPISPIGPLVVTPVGSRQAAGGTNASMYVYLAGGQDFVAGAAAIENASAGVTTSLSPGYRSAIEVTWTMTA